MAVISRSPLSELPHAFSCTHVQCALPPLMCMLLVNNHQGSLKYNRVSQNSAATRTCPSCKHLCRRCRTLAVGNTR